MKWAFLVPADQRPAILNKNHDDWKILKWVPRSFTAWLGETPVMLVGNADVFLHLNKEGVPRFYPFPIPMPGQWWLGITPPYFTMQTKGGLHVRAGFRWDDVDGYYALSFTIKRFQ